MIKFSKLTDYAVVVLSALYQSDEGLVSAVALANRTRLPEPTVSKVLKLLVKAELVTSTRGANGGYKLAHVADKITIQAIAEAIEGPVALTACVTEHEHECSISGTCPVNGRWNKVNDAVKEALQSVTLLDMAASETFLNTNNYKTNEYNEGSLR
jgi:FeS assembly SUF system regulator